MQPKKYIIEESTLNSGAKFVGERVVTKGRPEETQAKFGISTWIDGSQFVGEFDSNGPKIGATVTPSGKESFIERDKKNPGKYLHVTGKRKDMAMKAHRIACKSASAAELSPLFDVVDLRKNVDQEKLSVKLVVHPKSGTGLQSTKPIKKGKTIAYYKLRIFDANDTPRSTGSVYTFDIYDKQRKLMPHLTGDLCPESAPPTKGGVPYWAYFANEPLKLEDQNAEIDIATTSNFKGGRRTLKIGDHVTYRLVATRDIEKGEDILMCYGINYDRKGYKTECSRLKHT